MLLQPIGLRKNFAPVFVCVHFSKGYFPRLPTLLGPALTFVVQVKKEKKNRSFTINSFVLEYFSFNSSMKFIIHQMKLALLAHKDTPKLQNSLSDEIMKSARVLQLHYNLQCLQISRNFFGNLEKLFLTQVLGVENGRASF